MPLVATRGAASAQGFGEFAQSAAPVYIEEVFSTWLYTGNGSTQTINNGIDLSTKGGLLWIKCRNNASNQALFDSARGANNQLYSNLTTGQDPRTGNSFNTDGFTIGLAGGSFQTNNNGGTYASWTFRKQPKFFDVVTFTSAASGNTTFNHSLGSTPGFVIIKNTQRADSWYCYHRSLGNNFFIYLNLTNAQDPLTNAWAVSSTQVTINSAVMYASESYVAYVFAHDAGGFGLTGTDNVISCGSYTGTGAAGNAITLGYEPQWLMVKRANSTGSWWMYDNMRGVATGGNDAILIANSSGAEDSTADTMTFNATGFEPLSANGNVNASGSTYIYIAIRRGPMKTPTSGTSVFSPVAAASPSSPYTVTTNFPVDLTIASFSNSTGDKTVNDRLRGGSTTSYAALQTNSTTAEYSGSGVGIGFQSNTSVVDNNWWSGYGLNSFWWNFRRAPGFFDVVCYTGTGVNRTVNHNLGVVPELMIVKRRDAAATWPVYYGDATRVLFLEGTDAGTASGAWNNTAPTSTVFSVSGSASALNASGGTYVAYLFASCPGVSKVGTYTGTGALQTINCGFTGGARFVLIKRTSSTGNWIVWDTARGMVAGTDPAIFTNTIDAQTNFNSVYSTAGGFQILASPNEPVNINGASYIFLAIA